MDDALIFGLELWAAGVAGFVLGVVVCAVLSVERCEHERPGVLRMRLSGELLEDPHPTWGRDNRPAP